MGPPRASFPLLARPGHVIGYARPEPTRTKTVTKRNLSPRARPKRLGVARTGHGS